MELARLSRERERERERGMFISKKQKKAIRERKKKKKLAANSAAVKHNIVKNTTHDDHAPPQNGHKEQQQHNDNAVEESGKDNDATGSGPLMNCQVTEAGKRIVRVPYGMDPKETKKFRKDIRREARKLGLDEDTLLFVNEGDEVPVEVTKAENANSRKRKREFPNINQLIKENKVMTEKKAKKEAQQLSESQLSDEIKDQYVAVDCEMVGIGKDGKISALARVSVTDWDGKVLLDTFVKVPSKVTDFRTQWSGVSARHLKSQAAMDVEECRSKVAQLLKGKILVGHALKNDLDALMLTHPKESIRDTARYRPYQRLGGQKWRARKLRDLVKQHCDMDIQQEGESHDSVDDARAAMELFKVSREAWEAELDRKLKKFK